MASYEELTERTLKRFKDVDNVTEDDAQEWVETALNNHGFIKADNVPTKYVTLLLLFAEAEGTSRVALNTAYYFSFVDKDESVDKSMVSDNYRKLSEDLWLRYSRLKSEGIGDIGGARFRIISRIDRP